MTRHERAQLDQARASYQEILELTDEHQNPMFKIGLKLIIQRIIKTIDQMPYASYSQAPKLMAEFEVLAELIAEFIRNGEESNDLFNGMFKASDN